MRKRSIMDQNILEDIAKKAKSLGADAAEVLYISATDVTAGIRMGKQETLERSEHKALGLRLWVGKKLANLSTDDTAPERLDELLETAVAMAKASPEDIYAAAADSNQYSKNLPDLDICDTHEPDIPELMELCHKAEEAALAVKGVTNSDGAGASYGRQTMQLFLSPAAGAPFYGAYSSTNYGFSVAALAGEGTAMEEDYEYCSKRFYGDLADAATLGRKAGERVVTRLNAKSLPSCKLPIIWDKRVGKSLVGNFLSAINGSSVARGSSFLKDKRGEQVFAGGITIIDEPHMKRGLSSKPFDGEGLDNPPLTLVENGILKEWILDLRSANQLGFKSNGRARRGLGSSPSPGSTNTYMQSGNISREDLLAGVDKGFYVTDVFGMGINPVTGDYSQGARGFLIENGQLTRPISEITIASNLLDMFAHLTPADDLTFDFSTNVPTLRIDGMTIAGS